MNLDKFTLVKTTGLELFPDGSEAIITDISVRGTYKIFVQHHGEFAWYPTENLIPVINDMGHLLLRWREWVKNNGKKPLAITGPTQIKSNIFEDEPWEIPTMIQAFIAFLKAENAFHKFNDLAESVENVSPLRIEESDPKRFISCVYVFGPVEEFDYWQELNHKWLKGLEMQELLNGKQNKSSGEGPSGDDDFFF
jgi:hypothetical protein